MSSAPAVALPQDDAEHSYWQRISFVQPHCVEDFKPPPARFMSGDFSSSGDELATKVRKPYTITKQRERWTEEEHQKFLEALKLYGRAWRHIEEHIGTKTAVQIRSHAQKFFSKLEREALTGGSSGQLQDIEIPPPRPKRKPSHPYPRKAGIPATIRQSAMDADTRPSTEIRSSLSSVSDVDPNHRKAAAFSPYVSKTRPPMDAVHLQEISLCSPSSIRSQASMKLFGRTVVVPPADRVPASKMDTLESQMESPVGNSSKMVKKEKLSKDPMLKDKYVESNISMPKLDQHMQTFSPYIKAAADKAQSSCSSALNLNISMLGSGIGCLEGNGESLISLPCLNKYSQDQGPVPMTDGQCDEELDAEPVLQSVLLSSMRAQHIKNDGLEGSPERKDDVLSGEETAPAIPDGNNPDHTGDRTVFNSAIDSNNSFDSLMENLPQYQNNLPAVFPHGGCSSTQLFGLGTGAFGMPWHDVQSMAFHHPVTYPAAMAAIGWPGLMAGHQTAKLLELGSSAHRHHTANYFGDANAAAVAAASAWWALHGLLPPVATASAWWALHGLVLPGYSYPACGPVYGGADVPTDTQVISSTVTSVKPVDNIEVIESIEDHEQDQGHDATTDDEATTSEEVIESASEEQYEKSTREREECAEWIKESNSSRSAITLQVAHGEGSFTSRESSVYETGSPISSNTPRFANEETPRERELQNPGSSTDEGDGRRKRSREGSSSGSNTPLCELQTSDTEILNASGSDLSGMEKCTQKQCTIEISCYLADSGSQDCVTTGVCTAKNACKRYKLSEAKDKLRNLGRVKAENDCVSEIIINEKGCLKMRFKSSEKAEKTHHKERVGVEDGGKRFKSCAYDTEQWKEVSEEGRKAFQALFSHKTLPQTFSLPSTSVESKFLGEIIEKRKFKSLHTIKKLTAKDFQVSHGSTPQSELERDYVALLPQKGGEPKGVQDSPAKASGLLEEMETGGKQDMRNQDQKPGKSEMNHSKMIGMTSLHGHNDAEIHPGTFQPLLNSRKHVSAVTSCKGNSRSISGFIPYQRPSLEMYSHMKNRSLHQTENQ